MPTSRKRCGSTRRRRTPTAAEGWPVREQGDQAGAIADSTEALRLNPEYGGACYLIRGAARGEQGDQAGAIADFTEVLRLNPQVAIAYYKRGVARAAQGTRRAIADYTEALRLDPQHADAYFWRGYTRREQGDQPARLPTSRRPYGSTRRRRTPVCRGATYGQRGNQAEAIADYTEALRFNLEYADVCYYGRGVARLAQDDLVGAIVDFTEAIRLNPQHADAYCNRGVGRWKQGDQAGAIADFTEVLRLNPQEADAYFCRGCARQAQDDQAGAIADYEQYLVLGGGRRDGGQEEVEQRIRALRAPSRELWRNLWR